MIKASLGLESTVQTHMACLMHFVITTFSLQGHSPVSHDALVEASCVLVLGFRYAALCCVNMLSAQDLSLANRTTYTKSGKNVCEIESLCHAEYGHSALDAVVSTPVLVAFLGRRRRVSAPKEAVLIWHHIRDLRPSIACLMAMCCMLLCCAC